MRKLSVAINSLPQHLATFKQLQHQQPQITMIQDVETRWNSTYLMLLQGFQLKSKLRRWLDTNILSLFLQKLLIGNSKWEQVRYLIVLLQPYYIWTKAFSKTSNVTIHKA